MMTLVRHKDRSHPNGSATFLLDGNWIRRPNFVVENKVLRHLCELIRLDPESMKQAVYNGLERFLTRKMREGLRRGHHFVVIDVASKVIAAKDNRHASGESDEVLVRSADLIHCMIAVVKLMCFFYQIYDRHTTRRSRGV